MKPGGIRGGNLEYICAATDKYPVPSFRPQGFYRFYLYGLACGYEPGQLTRTQGYHWMAKKLRLSEQLAHIGGFEMDRCQRLIDLCEKERSKEAA